MNGLREGQTDSLRGTEGEGGKTEPASKPARGRGGGRIKERGSRRGKVYKSSASMSRRTGYFYGSSLDVLSRLKIVETVATS